ncbi:hypothetical protein OSB04_013057 [Centaurea solstitialis]|uniref:Uncharacterized protein n=1 Tax=Centaurea solstitialis TaxID=347529 RepID=A0AA38TX93_9ASTR|nr:hypothetical protein OSB04_013057 [Centaurea solstitialis]
MNKHPSKEVELNTRKVIMCNKPEPVKHGPLEVATPCGFQKGSIKIQSFGKNSGSSSLEVEETDIDTNDIPMPYNGVLVSLKPRKTPCIANERRTAGAPRERRNPRPTNLKAAQPKVQVAISFPLVNITTSFVAEEERLNNTENGFTNEEETKGVTQDDVILETLENIIQLAGDVANIILDAILIFAAIWELVVQPLHMYLISIIMLVKLMQQVDLLPPSVKALQFS